MAKGTVRYWTNKIDKVFHRYIRLRDTDEDGWGNCVCCGKRIHFDESDAGHFIGRQHKATRWDERNVHLQARKCNRFEYGNQYLYSKALGEELADELLQKSRQVVKLQKWEYEQLFDLYNKKMQEEEAKKNFL